jgi:hypothetical protein
MRYDLARLLLAGGAILWGVAFAWHPLLLDPTRPRQAMATIAATPAWPLIHLLAAVGLALWLLACAALSPARPAGVAAAGAALALWTGLLVAEATVMPPLARSAEPGATLLAGLAWPLGLALGYAALALSGVSLALAARGRPRVLAGWGAAIGWLTVLAACAGYFLHGDAVWAVGPLAAGAVVWSVLAGVPAAPRAATVPQRRRRAS